MSKPMPMHGGPKGMPGGPGMQPRKLVAACGNKLVEGSEKTYYGTVTDRAMSVVNEGDRQGRAYISITTDNEDIQFWLTKDCETNAQIGDKVIIESAIEEQTNLLVATSITVE